MSGQTPIERIRAFRAERLASGKCIECTEGERETKGLRCWWCRYRNRERVRAAYETSRTAGICVDCHRADAVTDRVRCAGCLSKASARKLTTEQARAYRVARFERGQCADCAQPRLSNARRCESCAERNRVRTKLREVAA